jgi:hypothetical protein
LYRSIIAVIAAFIPSLSIAGVCLGLLYLNKAIKAKDKLTQTLSIIAVIVGLITSIYVHFHQTLFQSFINQ